MMRVVKDYSLEEFIEEYGYWGDGPSECCTVKIINREKHKAIYSEDFKPYDRLPSHIMTRLLEGASEDRAIPKKTIASIGEIIKSKL